MWYFVFVFCFTLLEVPKTKATTTTRLASQQVRTEFSFLRFHSRSVTAVLSNEKKNKKKNSCIGWIFLAADSSGRIAVPAQRNRKRIEMLVQFLFFFKHSNPLFVSLLQLVFFPLTIVENFLMYFVSSGVQTH